MKETGKRRETAILAVYALVLGFALSLTSETHYTGIWGGPEQNFVQLGLLTILKGIGLAVPVFLAVYALNRKGIPALSARMVPGERKLSGRAFFLLCWGILVISWLPYLLTFYPGGVVGDGAETLEYAIHTDSINSRWGVTQIMAFRLFLAIGRVFSSDINTGIFLYALCSCLLYAAVCAAVIGTLRKKGVPNLLLILFLFVYAFFGHYASYSISLWKDSLFGAGITAFSLLLWTEPGEGEPLRAWAVKTGAVLLFLCFWRNFVSWGLLAAGVLLLILLKKKRLTALLMACTALAAIVVQGPVYGALGIRGQTSTEALAIPLQQTAAAISEGAELSGEQKETAERILPLEQWKELYTPAISDSIKFKLDDEWLQAHTGDFLKLWLGLGIRHPGAYARAYLMETAGFWQPYGSNKGSYHDWFLGVQDLYGRGYRERDLIAETTGYSLKKSLRGRLPFIPSGTLVWIMLLSLALILCRGKGQRRGAAILLPYVFCWAAVMGSAPIAYSYRYVEMLAVGLPLLLCAPLIREGGEAAPEAVPAREGGRRTAARAAALLAAGAMAAAILAGAAGKPGFTDGKLEIYTSGDLDNAGFFVREGLSTPEAGFRWTEGDRFVVELPRREAEQALEVTVSVAGTYNGTQRYTVLDGEGQELTRGELSGPGGIRFGMEAGERETSFTVELPDAVRISDVQGDTRDYRKVAMQISGIVIRQISGTADD